MKDLEIQGGPKVSPYTDISINRIKTCRQSYFFVEVDINYKDENVGLQDGGKYLKMCLTVSTQYTSVANGRN